MLCFEIGPQTSKGHWCDIKWGMVCVLTLWASEAVWRLWGYKCLPNSSGGGMTFGGHLSYWRWYTLREVLGHICLILKGEYSVVWHLEPLRLFWGCRDTNVLLILVHPTAKNNYAYSGGRGITLGGYLYMYLQALLLTVTLWLQWQFFGPKKNLLLLTRSGPKIPAAGHLEGEIFWDLWLRSGPCLYNC